MCVSAGWFKLKSLWQDVSYRRLTLALCLSLLLHLLFIGKYNFNLLSLDEKPNLIEARLVLSKPTAPTEQKLAVEKKSIKKKSVVKQKESEPPATLKTIAAPELQALPDIEPTPSISNPPSDAVTALAPQEVEPVPESRAEETSSIASSKPYAYIESEFDVYTDREDVPNRPVTGGAKLVYQRLPNGEQYQIKSVIHAKGLISLVIPDLLQTSEGFLDGIGLQPTHYLYQFGNKKDKTYSADFNWRTNKLILHSEKGEQILDLKDGTQDLLSFMYHFMFVPPMQNMQLNITNGRKLGLYGYTFEGEEVLSTKMGDLNTFHLLRTALEGEKKTELWLALDYQHVPVKIRETDKDGKVYELLVTSLKTELPTTSQE
jgi:hypothetical protein